jgi:hypothetical protein
MGSFKIIWSGCIKSYYRQVNILFIFMLMNSFFFFYFQFKYLFFNIVVSLYESSSIVWLMHFHFPNNNVDLFSKITYLFNRFSSLLWVINDFVINIIYFHLNFILWNSDIEDNDDINCFVDPQYWMFYFP